MVNSKTVDASLWWEPFSSLLTELENAFLSSDFPSTLAKKLKDNRAWLVGTVSLFKPPNEKSKEALNSQQLNIGPHQLTIQPELKEKALQSSSFLGLDEIQSYILVKRYSETKNIAAGSIDQEFCPVVKILLQYYIERQCLLKCIRQIIMHALHAGDNNSQGSVIREEALNLMSDGLEGKLISLLQDLLTCSYPEQMDVDIFTLWAEEILIEDNLVLDILFLIYYESFRTCNCESWKKLCSIFKGILSGSYNFGKLVISVEALRSSYHAKIQLLLILMETLDLEKLLQMVHDEVPFRDCTSRFSLTDVQEMDMAISTFDAFETKEAGPLILTWAVFICLIRSLPGKEENNVLLEIDHVSYVCQAFEASSLNYFLEILQSNLLRESDGPLAGYRSVLKSTISALIASYEINLQLDDSTVSLILDILCRIYQGEESLCVQFWDRDSFVDGPIRSLLLTLEAEFPIRITELVQFLSALCKGPWPAECVYNFLHKSVGISSLFEISNGSLVDHGSQIVETHLPLDVPGIEGLVIPSETRGRILKLIDGNTAIVRWEYSQSGVLVLLLHLVQELYMDGNEVIHILDLLSRLVSFNTAICFALTEVGNSLQSEAADMNTQKQMNFWVVEVICGFVRKLSPSANGAAMMSMCINILAKILKCFPTQVIAVAQKAHIFEVDIKPSLCDVRYDSWLSGAGLISGKLTRMMLIDCEHNDNDFPLVISVLEFTSQLLETGLEDDVVLGLVILSLQYVLVNHEYWKYKAKHVRWKVTLKVLEVMKQCVISCSQKLDEVIHGILLSDTSIHSALIRVICTTAGALEKLYISRLLDPMDIEGLELAICSVLDILFIMLYKYSKDTLPTIPVFHQAMLSSTTKPIPVAAVISLISYFRNPAIQMAAARLLSMLLMTAEYFQQYMFGNVYVSFDDNQITDLKRSVEHILLKQPVCNELLSAAVMNMLTSAAHHQPAFLIAIVADTEDVGIQWNNDNGVKQQTNGASTEPPSSKKSSLLDVILQYVERSNSLFSSNPRVLLNVLNFLKALWEGASQYAHILESLKSSKNFWKQLSECVSLNDSMGAPAIENISEREALNLAYQYQCQCAVMEIMGSEIFLHKKLLHAECLVKQGAVLIERIESSSEKSEASYRHDLEDLISSWSVSSVLSTLIKSLASCEYNNETYFRAKVATSLFATYVMGKLGSGNAGSLSVSLVEKIHTASTKLASQPAFSDLLSQYTRHGYSEGKELKTLILNDLYYHLQGEFEGRKIGPGPIKELFQYLLESKLLQGYHNNFDNDLFTTAKHAYIFDTIHIRADLALDMWDHTDWKECKAVAETMLCRMEVANMAAMLASSKLSSLRALTTILTIYEDATLATKTTNGRKIAGHIIVSCINDICQCFHSTIRSLPPVLSGAEKVLDFIAAQAELLLHLVRCGQKENLSLSTCVHIVKTTGSGLKVFSDLSPLAPGVDRIVKLALTLLLLALQSCHLFSETDRVTDDESVENYAEISNVCLGLLPIFCKCVVTTEHCSLSLATMNLIMRSFLTPDSWFPIVQQNLRLQLFILRLQDQSSRSLVPLILKFFLTLASVRDGAEMLLNVGFFSCLELIFGNFLEDKPYTVANHGMSLSSSSSGTDKPHHIWGLGLAVVTAIVHSLGDTSVSGDVADNAIPYFFTEKGHVVCHYLNAPDFPTSDHDKKRQRAQRTHDSLSALKETEQTLLLMCVLVKRWRSWIKAMKESDSLLREKCIHLLAFISRGTQRHGESSRKTAILLCPPVLKEEFDSYKKPSFVNSKNGWFAISPLGCASKPHSSAVSATTPDSTSQASETCFSDIVAVQIYRIAFLLLRFLCSQVHGAAARAEEVGFVDLAHFPELPMPEILHGLQDQAFAIVSELCEANKLKQVHPEIQSICLLLLQIMEMASYLELCVLQICGIRPVLGRVEDFAKQIKLLMRATEGHAFLKASVKSLKQIISLLYPGLQT